MTKKGDLKILKVWDKSTTGTKSQSASVYHANGIFPTINAGTHGYSMGQILEVFTSEVDSIEDEKSLSDKSSNTRPVKEESVTADIIQLNSPKHSNDSINLTLKENGDIRPHKMDAKKSGLSELNVNHTDNVSHTVSSSHSPKVYSDADIRIRKLTPTECERLQGYQDLYTQYGRKEDGTVYEVSNSQRYKMIGNGISSPVTAHLFAEIFGKEPVKVMSLFSGCGGTELLLPDNFKVIGHCEFDKYASDVLRYHYPEIPNFHDVTEFCDSDKPEFDLLVFGHPCQSFSAAGLRKGMEDTRGQLIYDVFRIIEKYKPSMIVGENVKGLLSHDKGNTFEQIMEALSELGYDMDFEVVNSKNFGLAQNRERVFYFGKLRE